MNFFVFKPPYTEYPAIDLRENTTGYDFVICEEEYVETPIYIETTKVATRNGIIRIGEEEYVDFVLDTLGISFYKELFALLIERVVKKQRTMSYIKTVKHTQDVFIRYKNVEYLRTRIRDVFIYGGKEEIPMKKSDVSNKAVRAILAVHSFRRKDDFFYFDIDVKQIYIYQDF